MLQDIQNAKKSIASRVRQTPLEHSRALSRLCNCEVFLKLEHFQVTGSFKARGALNRLMALSPEERARGIVTASSGNHGAAVAWAMSVLGMRGTVFVPENASPAKVTNIRNRGGDAVEVQTNGLDSGLTERHARKIANERGQVFVSPYNDKLVVAGQGTIGLELIEQGAQMDGGPVSVDGIFASVGGGGLIAGTGAAVKALSPSTQVIGVSPLASCDMLRSLEAGRIVNVDSSETLSDGTAGALEPGSITFEMCQRVVDGTVLLSENAIRDAMGLLFDLHSIIVEGAAAITLAALINSKDQWRGKNVVLVFCGGNLSRTTLQNVLRNAPTSV